MMKTLILCIAAICCTSGYSMFGQYSQEPIRAEQKGLGYTFYQNGVTLSPNKLLHILSTNPEAYTLMRSAKIYNDMATIFAFAGGFFIAYPLGVAISGGDPNFSIMGFGVLLVVVSVPFSTTYGIRASDAVGIYNRGLNQSGFNDVSLKIGLTNNGLGVQLQF